MSGYRAIALTASVSVFMQFLDSTAISTAIPAMARDLNVPPIDMNIAILAYQLTLVVFIPLGGVLAGRIGARNAFGLSLLVFMAGSILCALSNSLYALIGARMIEGIGGAVMMPVSRLLVVRSAAKHELISAMNWLLIPGIVGPLLGPALGGLLVTYASWHAIFLVNVPIALLGIVMTFTLIPDLRDDKIERFDHKGVLWLSLLIIGLVMGLSGAVGPRPWWITAALLASSLIFAAGYYRHYRTSAAPIVDLSLYSVSTFRHSMVSGVLIRVIFGAAGFLLPLWFQLAMGMSAAQTGMLMIMGSVGALVSRFLGAALIRHTHPRNVAVYGAGGLALALLAISCLRSGWPLPIFYALLFAQGLALAIAMLVIAPAAYVDVPPERTAAAASFYTTVQQLTLSLGVVTGVWAITAMRWLTDATPNDSGAYSGSLVILSLMAFGAMLVTRQLDPESTGTLRPETAPARA